MRLPVKALLGFLPFIVAIKPAAAQSEGPSTGTWGIEGSTGSASLLRFRSTSSAWVLGGNASLQRVDVPEFDPATGQSTTTETFGTAQVRLGIRRYGTPREGVRHFSTISGLLGYNHSSSSSDGWILGASADLGAAYFFSPHVSLGGAGELNASYGTGSSGGFGDRFAVSFAGIRLLGAVYF